MIRKVGERLEVSGAMTIDTASALLAAGNASLAGGENLFDLSGVTDVDSSGIAVIFGWLRTARAQGRTLRVASVPQDLLSLAAVYGVSELMPL